MESKSNHIDVLYPDDLLINHSGHLSDKQKRRLMVYVYSWYGVAGLDIVFFISLIYFQIYYTFIIPGIFGWYCFLGVVAFLCARNTLPYYADIKKGKVKSIAGRLSKQLSIQGRGIGTCTIQVSHELFTVSPSFFDTIEDEGFYRIYFVPNSRTLVNVEHL